jgi:chemotaxis protein histidine kinase CheA
MKIKFGSYLLLTALVFALALVLACGDTDSPATVPVILPTTSPPQSAKPLSTSDLEAIDEFAAQQQTVGQEWDRFHREFDQWRAGLTACHRSSVQEALKGFAVGFNAVTEQARDLPRTSVNPKLADMLIAAAEAEEAAFRQLRDRWQPNSPALFETVEQQRSKAAGAQKEVEDLTAALQEELEKAADPEELRAIEEFSAAFDRIRDDWEKFHDDYTDLLLEAASLDDTAALARLEQLILRFGALFRAVSRLPTADAAGDVTETLEAAAEAELTALKGVRDALAEAIATAEAAAAAAEAAEETDTSGDDESDPAAGPILATMDAIMSGVEATLKELSREIEESLDRSAVADLEELREFIRDYKKLVAEWDAFHEGYNEWRRTEGGCDRSEVLQSLGQFDTRLGELGLQVRDLPQPGYLLPIYNLLVEAVEGEEGAVRALRNSWQPFAVDAFIAVERERDNGNRLRREANSALEELRSRS